MLIKLNFFDLEKDFLNPIYWEILDNPKEIALRVVDEKYFSEGSNIFLKHKVRNLTFVMNRTLLDSSLLL